MLVPIHQLILLGDRVVSLVAFKKGNISYILPKIKAKDFEESQGIDSITINFIEATKPEEDDESE